MGTWVVDEWMGEGRGRRCLRQRRLIAAGLSSREGVRLAGERWWWSTFDAVEVMVEEVVDCLGEVHGDERGFGQPGREGGRAPPADERIGSARTRKQGPEVEVNEGWAWP